MIVHAEEVHDEVILTCGTRTLLRRLKQAMRLHNKRRHGKRGQRCPIVKVLRSTDWSSFLDQKVTEGPDGTVTIQYYDPRPTEWVDITFEV